MSAPHWRLATVVLLTALALAALHDLTRLGDSSPGRKMVDLSAFYCAGSVALRGQNPYELAGPVRTCEHQLNKGGAWDDPRYELLVPQPPYDIAAFGLLALASFNWAKLVLAIAAILAVGATALALADIGIPLWCALAALGLADGFVALEHGQIYPFAVMFAALAAALLHRKRDAIAGIFAALTLLSPQIGLPIVCTVFLWVPRARIAICATVGALAIIGTAALGPHAWIEWLTRVLPLAAQNETGFWGQYSLTSVLTVAGVPPGLAIAVGSLSSFALLILAMFVAQRLARTYARPEFYALVPAAFAPIGGTYVHDAAISASIGLALLLAIISRRNDGPVEWPLAAIAILLSIPWLSTQSLKPLFFSALFVAVVMLIQLRVAWRPALLIAFITALSLYALSYKTPPPILASTQFDVSREIAKLPTWLALLALAGISLSFALDKHPCHPERSEQSERSRRTAPNALSERSEVEAH
jgi:Glycosyltransferase family 87